MKHSPLSSPASPLSPDMDSGSNLGVRTRSSTKESERRRATVTPDGASSAASSGSTDVASTTTSDDYGSSTPPARRVIRSNITASSSYRDYENRADPLSPATRAACTRTWPDFFNMPSGLTPMQQRAFMQADLAAYNAELEARRATEDALGNLSYLRTRLQPSDNAYDADDEADNINPLNNNNNNAWGHDFEPFRPQRSLLTAVDPRQAFVNAVETVLPAIDVAHPPSLDRIRTMSPWEREVRVEAHREAMRRRHRVQMGERRYARAAAAGVRAEETAFEEENMVIEATRGFGGLAFERPEVLEESSSEEEDECEVEVVGEVVVISDDDDDDEEDDEEDDDDDEDNDDEMEDYDEDDDFGEDGDISKKRIKLESASPSPPAKRLRRSLMGQSQSSPKMPKALGDDLDDDLLMMKGESDEDD